LSST
jgi:hypothetical protein